ncbi:recombinase family protein [Paenisporosarcina quisquiliarum]|uniref:Recombinase family protein n=1 Tax=Paenisporosarcina quisquiliarum TaxID=365346 RepID=A0A9X3LHJ4_9BACL|nr:recombinase family protein [Paenisporosarcina quisquiliarum]MCZ8537837.1 recombinase family protein [Paenisporosarcina quisquiliarum]
MNYGYVRPTHDDSDATIQIQRLSSIEGIQIVKEKHDSAKKRIALDQLIQTLQPGDRIFVFKLYNLADSSRHLIELLDEVEQKGASILSIIENIDTNKKEGYSFNSIVRHLVQFQSDVISEKTKSGLNEAQKKGNTAGRPRKPDANVQKAILMHESKKYTLSEIKEATGISKSTLYRNLEN